MAVLYTVVFAHVVLRSQRGELLERQRAVAAREGELVTWRVHVGGGSASDMDKVGALG